MSSAFTDLTIVIPTYNREQGIRKSIQYWESIGVQVLILDGSDQRIFADGRMINNSRITYFHFPNVLGESKFWGSYGRRMKFAVKHVTTKYVALCADDDFLLTSGMVKALDLLETDPSLDAVTRSCVDYRVVDRTIRWNAEYVGWKGKNFGQSDQVEVRVKKANRGLINYYSIVRTKKWINLLEICFELEFSNKYINQLLMDEVGKILLRTKVQDHLLVVRQFNDPLKYRNLDQRLDQWLRDDSNLLEIDQLVGQFNKAFIVAGIHNLKVRKSIIKGIMNFYGSKNRGVKDRLMVLLVLISSPVPSKIRIGINRLVPQKLSMTLGYRGKVVDDLGLPLPEFCDMLKHHEIQFSEDELTHLSKFLLV